MNLDYGHPHLMSCDKGLVLHVHNIRHCPRDNIAENPLISTSSSRRFKDMSRCGSNAVGNDEMRVEGQIKLEDSRTTASKVQERET